MTLTDECGHHCAVKDRVVGHCDCEECHGVPAPPSDAEVHPDEPPTPHQNLPRDPRGNVPPQYLGGGHRMHPGAEGTTS